MSAKKELSVEEILAACRQMDGGVGGAAEAAPQESAAEASPAAASSPPASSPPSVSSPSSKPANKMSIEEMLAAARAEKSADSAESAVEPAESAPASSGPKKKPSEMSVAEMMAAARGEKTAGKLAAAKPAAAKPAAGKLAAGKLAAGKPAPKAGAAAKQASAPLDTASILSAARGGKPAGDKRGPISKAEAARQKKAPPKKIAPPVMPEKPAYAQAPAPRSDNESRRGFLTAIFGSFLAVGFFSLASVAGLWGLGLARFLFPNILTEPPSKFKVGFPADFAAGTVTTKFKAQFGVWIVNTEYEGTQEITALKSVCTHLGCTPNWLEGEQKFKCPCHGSGFYKDGINFEGPAPRPLERYSIRIADDGQVEIDKSKKFQQEMGQWKQPASYIKV